MRLLGPNVLWSSYVVSKTLHDKNTLRNRQLTHALLPSHAVVKPRWTETAGLCDMQQVSQSIIVA